MDLVCVGFRAILRMGFKGKIDGGWAFMGRVNLVQGGLGLSYFFSLFQKYKYTLSHFQE